MIKERVTVIKELGREYKLGMLLKISRIAKSSYFYCLNHMNYKEEKDKEIKEMITDIFSYNYEKYGVPRITLELRNRGYSINKKRVERIMKSLGIRARPQVKKYCSYTGEIGKICRNSLLNKIEKDNKIYYERDFTTLEFFKDLELDAYFSGCMTLTLTADKKIKKKDYILAVDVSDKMYNAMAEKAKTKILRIDTMHAEELTRSEKFALAEYYLYLYQYLD